MRRLNFLLLCTLFIGSPLCKAGNTEQYPVPRAFTQAEVDAMIFFARYFIRSFYLVHYVKFARYLPARELSLTSEDGFRPAVGATLFGSKAKEIVPLLLYYKAEKDTLSAITIQTEPTNPMYGYSNIDSILFDSLEVILSDGNTIVLIDTNNPVIVEVNTERWATRLFRLAYIPVIETEFEIVASGVARRYDATEFRFTYQRAWKLYRAREFRSGWSQMP